MWRRKETKIERKRGSARPFRLLSPFLAARNTCPGEGGSPDAGGQLRGHGRAAVLHEKRPICGRRLAGCCWRTNGRAGSSVPCSEPLSR